MGAPMIGREPKGEPKNTGQHKGDSARKEALAKREAAEAERLSARETEVAELLATEVAALPADIRDNTFVLNALRNKSNSQAALNAQYKIIHRLEPGSEASNDALKTATELFKLVQAATTDVLCKFPKPEENRTQKIPRSVADWLLRRDEYEGPVKIEEPEG